MRALTLKRPWPLAFRHGKVLENRTWKCYLAPGTQFALHTGSGWDASGADFMRRLGISVPPKGEHPTGIFAIATFQENIRKSSDPWFMGPVAWRLSDVLFLPEVIPISGQLGLWYVPAHELSLIVRFLQGDG